jgi:hypothetical protein
MLERTFDKDKINSVLKHEDIWPRIADKNQDINDFDPPMGDNHYLFSDGILFILHPQGDNWQIHANVIKDKRGSAYQAAKESLRYGFEEIGASRIVCKIPVKYGSVYGFALKAGMVDLGIVDDFHILALEKEQ